MQPARTPLFPLNTVLFPDGLLPLQIFEVRYLDMIRKCLEGETGFGVVALLEGTEVRKPGGQERLASVGTMARIDSWHAPVAGLLQIRCSGTQRFHISACEQLKHGLWVAETVALQPDEVVPVPEELRNVADGLEAYLASLARQGLVPEEMPVAAPFRLGECGWVANRWCELLPLGVAQRMLEVDSPLLRLELVQDLLLENGLLG